MQIRFLTSLAGRDFSYCSGEVIDASLVPQSEVTNWLNAGYAEVVSGEQRTATVTPASKAISRKRSR